MEWAIAAIALLISLIIVSRPSRRRRDAQRRGWRHTRGN